MLCHENFKWKYEHLTLLWNQQKHTVASWFTCVSLFWEQWESCMNWDVSVYTCSSTPTLCLGSLMTQAGLWGQGAGGCSVFSFPSMSPFPASLLVNKDVTSVGKDVRGSSVICVSLNVSASTLCTEQALGWMCCGLPRPLSDPPISRGPHTPPCADASLPMLSPRGCPSELSAHRASGRLTGVGGRDGTRLLAVCRLSCSRLPYNLTLTALSR